MESTPGRTMKDELMDAFTQQVSRGVAFHRPATRAMIARREEAMGCALAPAHRSFFLLADGMGGTLTNHVSLWPLGRLEWVQLPPGACDRAHLFADYLIESYVFAWDCARDDVIVVTDEFAAWTGWTMGRFLGAALRGEDLDLLATV